MIFKNLETNDAFALFTFYTKGLSEKSRRMFAPYPLFHTPPGSVDELRERIIEWKKEDDWFGLVMINDCCYIGFGLLKRYRSEQATSAIVIMDALQKRGFGYLLQSAIIEEARKLGVKRFHIKVISDNYASIKLHERCGFKVTRTLPGLYGEILQYLADEDKKNRIVSIDRNVLEMVIELGEIK